MSHKPSGSTKLKEAYEVIYQILKSRGETEPTISLRSRVISIARASLRSNGSESIIPTKS